jgi:hypothetical protein
VEKVESKKVEIKKVGIKEKEKNKPKILLKSFTF